MKPNTEPTAIDRSPPSRRASACARLAITAAAASASGRRLRPARSGAGTMSASLGASVGLVGISAAPLPAIRDRLDPAAGVSCRLPAPRRVRPGPPSASAEVSRSTCLAAANSSASSSASALSASMRDSSGGLARAAGGSAGRCGLRGLARRDRSADRGGSNGRVSSSSDWASNSDSRVAGSTGLPAPSVRSKEEHICRWQNS